MSFGTAGTAACGTSERFLNLTGITAQYDVTAADYAALMVMTQVFFGFNLETYQDPLYTLELPTKCPVNEARLLQRLADNVLAEAQNYMMLPCYDLPEVGPSSLTEAVAATWADTAKFTTQGGENLKIKYACPADRNDPVVSEVTVRDTSCGHTKTQYQTNECCGSGATAPAVLKF